MGFGNLGIALGAGVKTWQDLADSEAKNAHYAASTRKLNADADQAEAGRVANQQLGSAVDEAVASIYGGQQPVQMMPKVNPTAAKQPSVGQASMPGQQAKAPATGQVENNGTGSVDLLAPYTGQGVTALPAMQEQAPDFSAWRRTAAPKMIAAFIKAGKPEAARATMDFMRGEEGQSYSSEWLKGMTAYEAGDYDAAIPHLTTLYNTRRPDGRRIQIKASGNGEYDVDHLDENTGGVAATHRIGGKDLATFALNTMSPQQQIKWHLDRQGEDAKFSRELSLLDRRSQYQDAREAEREDRRDQRLNTRFEQQNELLDRKLEEGGGLTLAQRRGNLEIDAARQQLEGVSPAELKKRTQPYTATGRENPDFDPQLASRAKLAGRRKIGDDPVFDQRLSAQSAQPAPQPPTVQSRFTADPAMKGYRLGNQTASGFEVFDANGKLLGHYR